MGEIAKKVKEIRLKSYEHVMRRPERYTIGRRAMEMKVQGRWKRGRPKRTWLGKVELSLSLSGNTMTILNSVDVFHGYITCIENAKYNTHACTSER